MYRYRVFLLLVVGAIALTGCASRVDSSKTQSDRSSLHIQKCRGAGGDHRTCMEIASTLCQTGFEVFEQTIAEEDGVVRRGYYFQCKP